MSKLGRIKEEWEQLFTQFNNLNGNSVVCMVNKQSKKRIYFDMQQNRVLSKQEAVSYTIDMTGTFKLLPFVQAG